MGLAPGRPLCLRYRNLSQKSSEIFRLQAIGFIGQMANLQEREPKLPRPWAAPLKVIRRTPPARNIAQSGACLLPAELLSDRRMWSSVAFAKAVAAQQEDLGVLDETVRNRCGDGGVVKDIAPFGKCRVSGNKRGALVAVAS
jgi:hypothetical protein